MDSQDHVRLCINAKSFIDTSILLHVFDLDAGVKHDLAAKLLRELWLGGTGVLSTQALQEFCVNVTANISTPLTPVEARAIISRYAVWPVKENTAESIIRASEIQARYHLSF